MLSSITDEGCSVVDVDGEVEFVREVGLGLMGTEGLLVGGISIEGSVADETTDGIVDNEETGISIDVGSNVGTSVLALFKDDVGLGDKLDGDEVG